ncbi:MAG TPA: D-2-hydroxyacid dehydrogenase [Eubacteriales bacterium]|nr:D-2-hydroxyacid dehydrogenase [Clostridia bacterium]HRV72528.1 D-2-hydroxyacid dehydrogenase [Eubacteriales bacterium]
MQIVVLDGKALNPGDMSWDALAQFGTLSVYDRTAETDVVWRIRGADVVFTNKTKLSREVLATNKKLGFIGVLATGYDVVDVKAAKEFGIVVSNVPAYSTAAVAQHAIALLLEMLSNVGRHSALVQQGRWSACPDYAYWEKTPIEAAGLTMGIVGTGQIGQHVAAIAEALGMKVIGYAPRPKEGFRGEYVTLDRLLKESDVISLNCPANAETIGLINRDTIAEMKNGAIVINTARGALVSEGDIAEALESGKLSGYGTDVASREPLPIRSPLIGAPNCYVTSHYAWAPLTARRRLMQISTDNLKAYLDGKPQNVVS